jgi:hypothetical protein
MSDAGDNIKGGGGRNFFVSKEDVTIGWPSRDILEGLFG